ncbi:homeodomain-like protein [Artemisia annua]|uniref:Homeodomain-like protein n=1 Tax=Artemisia annua TaxID=35608 RepID=A0A2U1NBR2_ARTAN|nr:homeodomain-like protein [Artemisia annua]
MVATMVCRNGEQEWRKGPLDNPQGNCFSSMLECMRRKMEVSVAGCSAFEKGAARVAELRWGEYLRPGLKKAIKRLKEEGIIIEPSCFMGKQVMHLPSVHTETLVLTYLKVF